jgi:hypothetical protein
MKMEQRVVSLAGFQAILIGRFWVIAEGSENRKSLLVKCGSTFHERFPLRSESGTSHAGFQWTTKVVPSAYTAWETSVARNQGIAGRWLGEILAKR